jgi:hypothetical protein
VPGHPRPSLTLIPYSERTTSLGSGKENCRELPIILNKLLDSLRLNFYLPEGGCSKPCSPARWSGSPWICALGPPGEFKTRSCPPNPAPPPCTRVGGTAPPGGRRRASRRLCSVCTPRGWLGPARGEFLAPNSPLGPSVGWCPSKRVVVIHCARPYTAQKASGGCVRAISGSASKFAEDTCYEFATRCLCTHRFHSPRCPLIAFIRHAVRSSLSFAAMCTHSLGVLWGILPISYPAVFITFIPPTTSAAWWLVPSSIRMHEGDECTA